MRKRGWDFDGIVPAHFYMPVCAGTQDLEWAFRSVEDPGADAFPKEELRRPLSPISEFITTIRHCVCFSVQNLVSLGGKIPLLPPVHHIITVHESKS